ncbi:MAG: hypothetical protein KDA96_22690, partial [Planctomycetaceae bacterium]|nr:hypothetical protein [Planctomycetaceae bacterium]
QLELTLIDPRLQRRTVTLPQQAPGRYFNEVKLPQSGAYHLEIAAKVNDQVVYRQSRGLTRGYSDELRIRPANEDLLQEVAEVSGGQFNPAPRDVFRESTATTTRPIPLWPSLLIAASLLLLADVALRRIDFTLWLPAAQANPAGGV